jgi:integrase
MLHKGTNGYWRDTVGTGENKTTRTFGHYTKVSKTQAMVAWREWKRILKSQPRRRSVSAASPALTSVIQQFLEWAADYYRRADRTPTGEADNLYWGLQGLDDLYGEMPAGEFGPSHMQGFADAQRITVGPHGRTTSRQTINKRMGYVRRLFKWAKGAGIVPHVYERIRDVRGLSRGRTDAREADDIAPVPAHVVEETAEFLSPVVSDMVRVQFLAGMRPEDVCYMEAKHIKRVGKGALYQPAEHKNAWRNQVRRVWIGPKAWKIVMKYMELRPFDGAIFRNAKGRPFTTRTYRQAIWRACDRAFAASDERLENENVRAFRKRTSAWRLAHRWSPNQLRHSRLTQIENEHGRKASQTVAGHANAATTAIYVEEDDAIAKQLMLRIG